MKKIKRMIKNMPKRCMALLMVFAMIINYFLPVTTVFASQPNSGDYAYIQVNGVTNLEDVDNANSVTATFENGIATITGTGLYSDGNNTIYVPAGGNADIELTPNQDYSANLWVSGTNQNSLSTTLSNLAANSVSMIDAEFTQTNPISENITFQLDSATVLSNVITFDVDGTDVTATVSGEGYSFNGNNLIVEYAHINDVILTLDDNFNSSTMSVQLHNGQILAVNNNIVTFNGLNFNNDNAPHLQIMSNNGNNQGGNNTQNYQGNTSATLNYKVTGDIEYSQGMETGVGFQINGVTYEMDNTKAEFTEGPAYERDENGQLILDEHDNPIPIKDPETFNPITKTTGVTVTGDTIHYDNNDTNKVSFTFVTSWNAVIESIKINNTTINNLPSTKEELAAHYRNQAIEIDVNDIANATTYDIEIVARMATQNELYMGNFLWDYNPDGYTSPEDKILNGTLTFVKAKYNGHTYTTEEEIRQLGGIYNWNDAERKDTYTDEREGVGEAQFPTGTELTVKIIPDAGYQLIDFGINGGVFEPQEEIGTYTFEIKGGNFHLQATIDRVEDTVKANSESVASGDIEIANNEFNGGSARLTVNDANLSNDKISNFKEAAGDYTISNYLDIDLYNIYYKGKDDDSDVWSTKIHNLTNKALITLKLEDGVDVSNLVIVHNINDGDEFEIIEIESYDPKTNTITFYTDSFSKYAIATKPTTTSNSVTTSTTTSNPQTGDNIVNYIIMLVISFTGLTYTSLVLNRRKKLMTLKMN